MAYEFLTPFLGWLLYLNPAVAIMIIALIVSLIVTFAIKLFTDQSLMKDLKSELKELQTQMKELKNNPNKLAKVNSQFMETNMKYMSHSMRPTLFTFIPIIIVFGWLSSHLAYYPLIPDQPFRVAAHFKDGSTGDVKIIVPKGVELIDNAVQSVHVKDVAWILSGKTGEYTLIFEYNGEEYTKDIIITEEKRYAPVEKSFESGFLFFRSSKSDLVKIVIENQKILPFAEFPVLMNIPWVKDWGWLGGYFLFSLIFSMSLRRILKIY